MLSDIKKSKGHGKYFSKLENIKQGVCYGIQRTNYNKKSVADGFRS